MTWCSKYFSNFPFPHNLKLKKKNWLYILEQFWIYSKTVQKIQSSLISPLTSLPPASFTVKIPHQSCTFVSIGEPTLTQHYNPKSIVYIRVHFWCCTFYRFWQMYNDMSPTLWYPAEWFHCPENPLCSTYSSLPIPKPW